VGTCAEAKKMMLMSTES